MRSPAPAPAHSPPAAVMARPPLGMSPQLAEQYGRAVAELDHARQTLAELRQARIARRAAQG